MRPPTDSPHRLIVEGRDDRHTVIHLLARHGYAWDDDTVVRPHVHEAGSDERVLESISVAVKTYERVGLVLDADMDCASRWAAVAARLTKVGYSVAPSLAADGAVLEAPTPRLARVGVWIMPDNESAGRLEEMVKTLVPATDRIWSHAVDSTSAAVKAGAPLPAKDELKGALHAWLAWQNPPGMAYGTALKSKAFAHDSAEALRFVEWFSRLFSSGSQED